MIHIPQKLRPRDKVAVIATARVIDKEAVNAGLAIIKNWGLDVVAGQSLYRQHHLFAGSDEQRLADLQWAIDNPSIRAVFCARGGYGTSRILDQIDWRGLIQSPKWICGFSDVTALLCHANKLGLAGLHSTMPQVFLNSAENEDSDSLKKALFDGEVLLEAPADTFNRTGVTEADLIGGNLSILTHLIGTSSDFDTKGKILVIEEVDEYLYHLDRMMIQLKRSGKLTDIAGLAVGHLTKMKEGNLKFGTDARGVISSHVTQLNIPIAFGLPFGHESPNLTLPLGIAGKLEVTESGSRLVSKY